MCDVMRRIRGVTVAVVMATLCTPAYSADPLTLLLLRLVRDKIISAGIESAVDSVSRQQSRMPPQPTPNLMTYGLDDAQLRRLIDEGFLHLSAAQRDEVHVSLRRIIADPKNAADVPAIVADLAVKASAVRQAHEQINSLSSAQKRRIAAEAREEYEKMPPETREQMASVLRQRLVPMPADLTDMILAGFDQVRSQTRTSANPPTPGANPVASTTPQPTGAPDRAD